MAGVLRRAGTGDRAGAQEHRVLRSRRHVEHRVDHVDVGASACRQADARAVARDAVHRDDRHVRDVLLIPAQVEVLGAVSGVLHREGERVVRAVTRQVLQVLAAVRCHRHRQRLAHVDRGRVVVGDGVVTARGGRQRVDRRLAAHAAGDVVDHIDGDPVAGAGGDGRPR